MSIDLAAQDTIVAPATAPGVSAVAIVRLTGPDAWTFANKVFPRLIAGSVPRQALFGRMKTPDDLEDEILVLPFRGPHSYTGEDLVEFHLHGNDLLVAGLTRALTGFGARPAQPGEFTQRAFLNGKLDLARAEAVAELIEAKSDVAARGAAARLAGELSTRYRHIREQLLDLLVHLESTIDFPDEDIETLGYPRLLADLDSLLGELAALQSTFQQGRVERDGLRVAIAGRPNAGKSSLMNKLLGIERAIVTPIPGTTRDYLEEHVVLAGAAVRLYDTAGLRDSEDVIEREGIRRTREQIRSADLLIYVIDGSDPGDLTEARATAAECPGVTCWVINKSDLGVDPSLQLGHPTFHISAQTGEGIPSLLEYVTRHIGATDLDAGVRVASARQVRLIDRCQASLAEVRRGLESGVSPELASADLRDAIDAVGELTGEIVNDELLGEIFSRFCIGK